MSVASTCCFLIASLLIGAAPGSAGNDDSSPDVAAITAFLESQRQQEGFPGANFAWTVDGTEIHAVSVGVSDREARAPMRSSDRLLSGSIGKTYVAAVLFELMQEEERYADDSVAEVLGHHDWFARLPNAQTLTIRSLLNHTSGIREYVQDADLHAVIAREPDHVWTPVERLEYVFDDPPLFAVGEGWSYADTNYLVLGVIIEELTGEEYYDVVTGANLGPIRPDRHRTVRSPKNPGIGARL